MKEYVAEIITYSGHVNTKLFTNLRKAKSYCWKWINKQKAFIRDRNGDRNYEELSANIKRYYNDADNKYEVLAVYK